MHTMDKAENTDQTHARITLTGVIIMSESEHVSQFMSCSGCSLERIPHPQSGQSAIGGPTHGLSWSDPENIVQKRAKRKPQELCRVGI